ncbi:MAG: hypothetical protein IPN94_10715 [Sphingobacteriales bacterium]|nr:hypothetical protein [Sphingobacteriales bacterium]
MLPAVCILQPRPLGNYHLTYSTTCNGTLQTQTALDYYPYGKELRAYNSAAEKYKSTTNLMSIKQFM